MDLRLLLIAVFLEVVHGGIKTCDFHPEEGYGFDSNLRIGIISQPKKRLDCAMHCTKEDACESFDLTSLDGGKTISYCEFFPRTTSALIAKPGTTHYHDRLIDECDDSPCHNGGVCTDLLGTFRCDCPSGLIGTICQTDIDECTSDPCLNGGVCDDQVNGFYCSCPYGYIGSRCEDVDPCAGITCPSGQLCTDLGDTYACSCPGRLFGPTCNIECPSGFYLRGQMCVMFHHSPYKTWDEAKASCQSQILGRTRLVEFHSKQEFDALEAAYTAAQAAGDTPCCYYQIAGKDLDNDGNSFTWERTNTVFSYNKLYPSLTLNVANECLLLRMKEGIVDHPCGTPQKYVCQVFK